MVDLSGIDQQGAVVSLWFLELDHVPPLPDTPSYSLDILQEVYHSSSVAGLTGSTHHLSSQWANNNELTEICLSRFIWRYNQEFWNPYNGCEQAPISDISVLVNDLNFEICYFKFILKKTN